MARLNASSSSSADRKKIGPRGRSAAAAIKRGSGAQRGAMSLSRERNLAKRGRIVESSAKPTNRPSGGRSVNWKDPKAIANSPFSGIPQSETKWVRARTDTKSGKKIGGFLAYRSGPNAGKPVTGNVRIERPGSTYVSQRVSFGTRGQSGSGSKYPSQGTYSEFTSYSGGRNVKSSIPSHMQNLPRTKKQAAPKKKG